METTNHLERCNKTLKYNFLSEVANKTLGELLTILVNDVTPHYFRIRALQLCGRTSSSGKVEQAARHRCVSFLALCCLVLSSVALILTLVIRVAQLAILKKMANAWQLHGHANIGEAEVSSTTVADVRYRSVLAELTCECDHNWKTGCVCKHLEFSSENSEHKLTNEMRRKAADILMSMHSTGNTDDAGDGSDGGGDSSDEVVQKLDHTTGSAQIRSLLSPLRWFHTSILDCYCSCPDYQFACGDSDANFDGTKSHVCAHLLFLAAVLGWEDLLWDTENDEEAFAENTTPATFPLSITFVKRPLTLQRSPRLSCRTGTFLE